MTTTITPQHHLLASQDGMLGESVHPLDATNPMYAGRTDCTSMNADKCNHWMVETRSKHMPLAA